MLRSPLAIPMALGLTLGIILAVSGGGRATTLTPDANGVATGATFNTAPQKAKIAGGGNGRGRGAGHRNWWADFMPGRNGHV